MTENLFLKKAFDKIVLDPYELKLKLRENYSGSKIVLVKGVYDLFHSGHLYSFTNAKSLGDVLVVAVNSDEKVKKRKGNSRPIINQRERMLLIAALDCVDWVTLYDQETPFELLKPIKPNVFAASHFDLITELQFEELRNFTTFQIISKQGDNSTTSIINKILKLM